MDRSMMRRLGWNLAAAVLMVGAFFVGGFPLVVGIIVVFLLTQLISAVERIEDKLEDVARQLRLPRPQDDEPEGGS